MNEKQQIKFPHLYEFYERVEGLNTFDLKHINTGWEVCAVGNRILDEFATKDKVCSETIKKIISPQARELGVRFTAMMDAGKKSRALCIINKVAKLPSLFCTGPV